MARAWRPRGRARSWWREGRAGAWSWDGRWGGRRGRIRQPRDRDREGRAFTYAALHRYVALEQSREAAGDRETETGSARASRRLLLDLPERVEHLVEVFLRNADTRVVHRDLDVLSRGRGLDADGPAVRELHCVGEQVHDHLPDFHRRSEERRVGA